MRSINRGLILMIMALIAVALSMAQTGSKLVPVSTEYQLRMENVDLKMANAQAQMQVARMAYEQAQAAYKSSESEKETVRIEVCGKAGLKPDACVVSEDRKTVSETAQGLPKPPVK